MYFDFCPRLQNCYRTPMPFTTILHVTKRWHRKMIDSLYSTYLIISCIVSPHQPDTGKKLQKVQRLVMDDGDIPLFSWRDSGPKKYHNNTVCSIYRHIHRDNGI